GTIDRTSLRFHEIAGVSTNPGRFLRILNPLCEDRLKIGFVHHSTGGILVEQGRDRVLEIPRIWSEANGYSQSGRFDHALATPPAFQAPSDEAKLCQAPNRTEFTD